MKKLLPLLVASGLTTLVVGSAADAISKGITTEVKPLSTIDLISCGGGGGGGGGGGNSAKKRAAKAAMQEELRQMLEEKKSEKKK